MPPWIHVGHYIPLSQLSPPISGNTCLTKVVQNLTICKSTLKNTVQWTSSRFSTSGKDLTNKPDFFHVKKQSIVPWHYAVSYSIPSSHLQTGRLRSFIIETILVKFKVKYSTSLPNDSHPKPSVILREIFRHSLDRESCARSWPTCGTWQPAHTRWGGVGVRAAHILILINEFI